MAGRSCRVLAAQRGDVGQLRHHPIGDVGVQRLDVHRARRGRRGYGDVGQPEQPVHRAAVGVDGLHPGNRRDAALLHEPTGAGEYGLRADLPTVYPVTPERDHPDVHHHRHRGESGRGQVRPGRLGMHRPPHQLRDHREYPAQRRGQRPHHRRLAARSMGRLGEREVISLRSGCAWHISSMVQRKPNTVIGGRGYRLS
ncbi:Putative uncharacterized protein [Mycobacterium tuberculosis variant bovis]|nr:Putative uncharacterized protein [Mycobacterium tuberculosis variant bovis]CEJ36082.1 Putative uncharacterized protein [Mycobacterium tuberculosis variant bovis]